MSTNSEFRIEDAYRYDTRTPARWVVSHLWRYKGLLLVGMTLTIGSLVSYSSGPVLVGYAAAEMVKPGGGALTFYALSVLGVLCLDGVFNLAAYYCFENLAKRFSADARQELYASLIGKSQTFHNRQRVGDIMARATDDVGLLSDMTVPGASLIYETVLAFAVPLFFIGLTQVELLLMPLAFLAAYCVAVWNYNRELRPVTSRQRQQFGQLNAGLEETLSGIEVVKASAREALERDKFQNNARALRDTLVKQGSVEARYVPVLLYAITLGLTFWHALWLYEQGRATIAQIISVMGLVTVLRFPTFVSIFTFSLVQAGLSSAERILAIIKTETELDENAGGLDQPVHGAITFEQVSFGYADRPVLQNVSFEVKPGETVAIVGQTGSGKSSLTALVNRTYEPTAGRVLIDGVDIRQWSLNALRSQIGKIEQDIFLFSRTIRENIDFGKPSATHAEIEQAARDAQAHEFILALKAGYETVIGERGVTLSGGQRQRLALARAFLSNPPILILDDSTSAIDSATEDEIQKALRRIQRGRTTLLITHRLSQIRWADHILVLDKGRLVAAGAHDELLRRSQHYRRIFARYDLAMPELEPAPGGVG